MSTRKLAKEAADVVGTKNLTGFLDLSDDNLRKIIKKGNK